ncbi:MAG TPA: alpha/beta fold hydrolase [Mycobacteriales bacterium]|nr:alpha/beta fold hydrolase [Mycobacteriales bacterium]
MGISRGARTLLTVGSVTGTLVEVAWLAAHVASYPFGVVQEKTRDTEDPFTLDGLKPIQRGLLIHDVEAAGTPILLLHGMVDNRSIFALLRRQLRRRGFGRVASMNYQIWTSDVRSAAKHLGETIETICEQTGYERIHVVGHSMGGLIARYYVQRLGGDARVHTIVTLGTPHRGTHAARLLPAGVCRQLIPGSEVLEELEAPAPTCQTRFVCFWSDIDALISPKESARLDHPDLTARNILVRGVGHLSLPIHRRIVHEIVSTLAHLDSDGATVTAGVTRIAAQPTPPKLRAKLRPARRNASTA